jgi:hypothetical protein
MELLPNAHQFFTPPDLRPHTDLTPQPAPVLRLRIGQTVSFLSGALLTGKVTHINRRKKHAVVSLSNLQGKAVVLRFSEIVDIINP